MEEEYTYEEYEETYEVEPPKKKSKLWIWIVVAVLAVALLAAAALLVLPKLTGGKSADDEWTLCNAYITSDKSVAYIILPGGESVKVKKDGIVRATITEDFKHIAVLLDDGTLYVTDKDLKAKQTIAEDAKGYSLGDTALIYHDKDGRYHRASLDGKTVLDLPKETGNVYITSGKGKLSMAFEGKNEGLYVLPDGAEEWQKIGSDVYSIRNVSNDGKVVVWTSVKSGKTTLYLTEGEDKFSLGDIGSNAYAYTLFSKDQKLTVVYVRVGDDFRIWIKPRGKDVQAVKFSNVTSYNSIVSNAGRIPETNASQIKSLFVSVSGSGKSTLYRISLNGEKEKLFSKDASIRYMAGNVAYRDDDNTLFVAKVSKDELGEATKLSGDVAGFSIFGKGKYLYYIRDEVVYGYKFGAKEPIKIASGAEDCYVSDNGQYAVVLKDGDKNTGFTLSLWKFGDKAPVKFATDATIIRVEDSGGVYYRRVDGKTFDLMYYNGKESKKIGTDLKVD